jgi:hypothetical protein
MMAMAPDRVRKPRNKPAPYASKPGPKGKRVKEQPATSAKQQVDAKRDNLTLQDWLTVFAFIDDHPSLGQSAVVAHFKGRAEGALVFTQSTLSRKLKTRPELEARVGSNPNALSSKRPRVVTCPEVERALVLWMRSMEEKGETVNGPMLLEKRQRFEKSFSIPDEQCLQGDGWIASFCKMYASALMDREVTLTSGCRAVTKSRNVAGMGKLVRWILQLSRLNASAYERCLHRLQSVTDGISMRRVFSPLPLPTVAWPQSR